MIGFIDRLIVWLTNSLIDQFFDWLLITWSSSIRRHKAHAELIITLKGQWKMYILLNTLHNIIQYTHMPFLSSINIPHRHMTLVVSIATECHPFAWKSFTKKNVVDFQMIYQIKPGTDATTTSHGSGNIVNYIVFNFLWKLMWLKEGHRQEIYFISLPFESTSVGN